MCRPVQELVNAAKAIQRCLDSLPPHLTATKAEASTQTEAEAEADLRLSGGEYKEEEEDKEEEGNGLHSSARAFACHSLLGESPGSVDGALAGGGRTVRGGVRVGGGLDLRVEAVLLDDEGLPRCVR